MKPQNRVVEFKIMKCANHYFLPGSSFLHTFDNCTLTSMYDIETFKNDKRNLNLYLEICNPKHADMLYGSHFEFTLEDEHLLDESLLIVMVESALPECYNFFRRLCAEANIESPELLDTLDIRKGITENIKSTMPYRLMDQKANKGLRDQKLLSLSAESSAHLFLQATFIVMDQLLMINPHCNRFHNREMMLEHINFPFQIYVTLRNKIVEATNKKITFNALDTTLILLAADCAIQMLLSPQIEIIAEGILENGLTDNHIKKYIKIASELRKDIKENLRHSGATITNLEKNVDWTALIK